MELRQLTALVTVAEVGSVTGAAKLLHIVQPAVTRQIHQLEEELGVPLFERTRNGMVPTPAAEVLIMRARRALHELDAARAELRPEPGEVTGIVSVGLLESVLDILAQPFTEAVARRHPGIELRLFTDYSLSWRRTVCRPTPSGWAGGWPTAWRNLCPGTASPPTRAASG